VWSQCEFFTQLGPKEPDNRIAEIAQTAVRIAKAIHDASVKSVQIR